MFTVQFFFNYEVFQIFSKYPNLFRNSLFDQSFENSSPPPPPPRLRRMFFFVWGEGEYRDSKTDHVCPIRTVYLLSIRASELMNTKETASEEIF